MKRTIAILSVILMLVILLAACGEKSDPTEKATPDETSVSLSTDAQGNPIAATEGSTVTKTSPTDKNGQAATENTGSSVSSGSSGSGSGKGNSGSGSSGSGKSSGGKTSPTKTSPTEGEIPTIIVEIPGDDSDPYELPIL